MGTHSHSFSVGKSLAFAKASPVSCAQEKINPFSHYLGLSI